MTRDPDLGFVVVNGLVCFAFLASYLTALTSMSTGSIVVASGLVALLCGVAVAPALLINMLLGLVTIFLGILWILQVIVA